jgi:phosphoserine aminotransferase
VPLVADMSSNILSRPIDVSKFGLIYAGAQKNIGPAGLVVVIVREDLLGWARPATPLVFDYKQVADDDSMLNTPPTFAWYMAGLVFKWLKKQGGLAADRRAQSPQGGKAVCGDRRSGSVPQSGRAGCAVADERDLHPGRSVLDAAFLAQAAAAGLKNLKGHRAVGGMRASLYNSMPLVGVEALIEFMREFERKQVRG